MKALCISALVALACTSCAGVTANSALPDARDAGASSASAPLLFVASISSPWVRIAEYSATGGAPLRTISKGIVGPRGFAMDGLGTLYSVNHTAFSSYDVTEYDAGSTSVARTLKRDIGNPSGATTDSSGAFYFLNVGQPLVKYAHGATKPSYATSKGLCGDQVDADLATDGSGNTYVLNMCASPKRAPTEAVLEYDSNGVFQRSIALPQGSFSSFLVVDASGRLFLQYFSVRGMAIDEYDPGQSAPAVTAYFGPRHPLLAEGYTPILDAQTGELVANLVACTKSGCSSALYVFDPGAAAPKLTINLGVDPVVGPPHLGGDDTIYAEVASRNGNLSIRAYPNGSTRFKTILQGHYIGELLFVWPNAGSAKLQTASANFLTGRRTFAKLR